MSYQNIRQLVDAENNGQTAFFTWRKTPNQITLANIWFDLSMSPGNPVPNYYIASFLIATALAQSTDGGIGHGSSVAQLNMKKYLKAFMGMVQTATAIPLSMILCDYLLFYPFIDMSTTDPQAMTNNVTLPRYITGKGVKIMAVEVAGQSGIGNPQFFVNYTNSDGISGRQTANVACNAQVVNGTIITTSAASVFSAGPFLPLQRGDKGVRQIDSVTFLSPDYGLIALVLVYPIENIAICTIDAPAERVPIMDFSVLPIIEDDAYLNLICCPLATLANAPIHGYIQTIWG